MFFVMAATVKADGTVIHALLRAGHAVRGLVRAGREALPEGAEPVSQLAEAVAESRGARVSAEASWSGCAEAASAWWGWRRPDQAVAGAVVCRQSLRRLWAAVARRHSDRAADLPRRKKRSMRRLNLVSAKTGSIIVWRLA